MFQAEITAITNACRYMVDIVDDDNITIFCDSQAALLALANPNITSKVVLECVDALNNLCGKVEVTLQLLDWK